MEHRETTCVNRQVLWQITQGQKEDGTRLPAIVTTQGRRYEWKHEQDAPVAKLLNLARSGSENSWGTKPGQFSSETLFRSTNSACLSYERRDYDHGGSLTNIIRRSFPLSSLDLKEEGVLSMIENWSLDHVDLTSLSSLKFVEKARQHLANYTVYISASIEGEVSALRLCKMIDAIGPAWGIHSTYLSYTDKDEAHYKAAIDSADLFIVLVDADYGLSGTRSQLELQYAASLNGRKSWPWTAPVYLTTRHDWVTEAMSHSPSLFLHGKNPKEYLDRISSFMLALLIRKRKREQATD